MSDAEKPSDLDETKLPEWWRTELLAARNLRLSELLTESQARASEMRLNLQIEIFKAQGELVGASRVGVALVTQGQKDLAIAMGMEKLIALGIELSKVDEQLGHKEATLEMTVGDLPDFKGTYRELRTWADEHFWPNLNKE